MMTRKTLGLLLCAAFFSVTQSPAADGVPIKSFTYKKAKQGDLEMVVHYPPGWKETDRRPAIVFFFGGGWTNGSVKQFETQATHLASRGMVAARADYRIKSKHGVTPKACVEDAKSAVRWLRQNAAKLGVDPDRIVAAGGSAGGHIAACTALAPGLDAEGEDDEDILKAQCFGVVQPGTSIRQPSAAASANGERRGRCQGDLTDLVSDQGHAAHAALLWLGRPAGCPGRGVHEEVEGTGSQGRVVYSRGPGPWFL